MAADVVFVSRVVRLPLVDADGELVGRIADIVLAPPHHAGPPVVLGFVAAVQRRKIFVNAARVGEVDPAGVRLRSGTIDLRHFKRRPGEVLAFEQLLGSRLGTEAVADLSLRRSSERSNAWEVASVALHSAGALRRRRSTRVVDWREAADLFRPPASETGDEEVPVELAGEIATYRQMHPSDVAAAVRALPMDRRRRLAEAMEDDRLADLLEELPEEEQLELIAGLDLDRVAHVLEEMAPDDAADLLGEMASEQQTSVLDAMQPEEAADLRRLLRYDEDTAGGLMTPEPVILPPSATVAEALARLRDSELPRTLAAQVFVVRPPLDTPTGRFLGDVGFQRLLREPPGMQVGNCVDDDFVTVAPDLSHQETAAQLAAYNLLAVGVVDGDGRLVGAVTVDDVLDRVLPVGWRGQERV